MEAFDGESHGGGEMRAKDDWNYFDALTVGKVFRSETVAYILSCLIISK